MECECNVFGDPPTPDPDAQHHDPPKEDQKNIALRLITNRFP